MLLIQNGHIKPISGEELENGAVLIGDDGKILAVAVTIPVPDGCQVIDAQGRLVTPGCVDAHCHIGLDNEAVGWEGMDYNEIVDPLTPQMRAIDSSTHRTKHLALLCKAVLLPLVPALEAPMWLAAHLSRSNWRATAWIT